MSKTPTTVSSSSTLDDIMKDLREEYEKNESLRPFIKKLEGKSTAAEIRAVFCDQVKEYNSASYDKLMKSLNPIVNVLCASSSVIGAGVGLVYKPASVIFAGADVLLSAAKGVIASYNALIVIFEDIGNFFHRLEKNTEKATMEAIKDIIVETMGEVFKIFAFMTKEVKLGRAKRFLKTVSRNFVGNDIIKDALGKLDRLTQEGLKRVIEHTSNTADRIESNLNQFIKDDQERKALEDEEKHRQKIEESRRRDKEWLSPPDPSTNQNKNIASQAQRESSATWIFEESIFMDWNSWWSKPTTSLLWIHGKPGSGKSVLSSAIIEEITALQKAGRATMAYFYFVFNDLNKQSLDNALRSLLTQLSASSDSYCDILSRVYKECNNGTYQPNTQNMVKSLIEMLKLPDQRPVYIILDALDECPQTSGDPPARQEVLDLLTDLVGLPLSNLHICVTSRPEVDIKVVLSPLAFHAISIHEQDGQKEDIGEYIKSEVVYAKSGTVMSRWRPQDKELVMKTLTEKADGMFRWVFCQLEVLRRCLPLNIRRTLNALPKSLDETYERVLKEIGMANGVLAHRLLQCLTMAIRPLRVEELAEILAFDFEGAEGSIPKLNEDCRSENPQEDVLSTCSSLITVVDDGDSRVIQFSHFSVKEYLTSDRLCDASHFHIMAEPAHTTLAQACLGTLLHLDGTLDDNQVERSFPFAKYASLHWVEHAQFGTVSLRIEDGIRRLFDSAKPHLAAWLQLHDIDDCWEEFTFDDPYDMDDPLDEPFTYPRNTRPGSSLYYASLCGLRDLATHIIVEHPEQVNARGGRNHRPLVAALHKRHFKVAELLYLQGAVVDLRDSCYQRTPLHTASSGRLNDVVRWLLGHGADADSQDCLQWTPLMKAANRGHLEVVRMLLGHGVRINAVDDGGETALHKASDRGYLEIVELLLKHDADINIPDDSSGSVPLHAASYNGRLAVVRLLLDHGADVNAKAKYGSTPLHLATDLAPAEVVRLLLERGANVNAEDNYGRTPLHRVSELGSPKVVRLLLDYGACAYTEDKEEWTPLQLASMHDYSDIVQMMIDHDPQVDVVLEATRHIRFRGYFPRPLSRPPSI